jgi:hypothetical protein
MGFTVRHEENAGVMFYRAIGLNGWESPYLRATYRAALGDATLQAQLSRENNGKA